MCGREFEHVLGFIPGDLLLREHDTFKQLVQASVIYVVGKTKLSFS